MTPRFEAELDAYERALGGRVGSVQAAEMRREVEAHLLASYEARLEVGETDAEARAGALASVGDLRLAARGERRDRRDALLFVSPPLVLFAFVLGASFGSALSAELALLIVFGPAGLAAFASGLGQRRVRWRPFFAGWGAALALATGAALLFIRPLAWSDVTALWVPALLFASPMAMHLVAVGLTRFVLFRRDGGRVRLRSAQMLAGLRFFAPLVASGVSILGFLVHSFALNHAMMWILLAMVGAGMYDRRRLDVRAIVGGVLLVVLPSIPYDLVLGGGWETVRRYLLLPMLTGTGLMLGWTFAGQLLGLGLWALVRRGSGLRRAG